jgi:3-phosphoshikimate 1-carboxyvinyltransferase
MSQSIQSPGSNSRTFRYQGPLHGSESVPGDKSMTHRAILFGALATGTTQIYGWLDAADCRSSMHVVEQLGATVYQTGNALNITGTGGRLREPEDVLDCGNSGTTMRMFTGALAAKVPFACLTGDDSLRRRPMQRVLQPLLQMGASVQSRTGYKAPLCISGEGLHGIEYTLPVASAQVKSAVLIAGMLASEGVTTVTESVLTRDHTENMLEAFGVKLQREPMTDGQRIQVQPAQQLQGAVIEIPGDFSSAAFLIAAGLLVDESQIVLENVGVNPTRVGLLRVLDRMGARIERFNHKILVKEDVADIKVNASTLQATTIVADEIPSLIDELPIIAILATRANGMTSVTGARELRVKETDRIHALVTGLRAIGVKVDEWEDGFSVEGPQIIQGGVVDSFGDHRIAMSFAIAGLISAQGVTILGWDCVDISFPEFENALRRMQK